MNATTQWDSVCSQFNFPTTANAAIAGTFASAHYGEDFDNDFASVLQATAELCGTNVPGFDGDDELRTSIENWPDS